MAEDKKPTKLVSFPKETKDYRGINLTLQEWANGSKTFQISRSYKPKDAEKATYYNLMVFVNQLDVLEDLIAEAKADKAVKTAIAENKARKN